VYKVMDGAFDSESMGSSRRQSGEVDSPAECDFGCVEATKACARDDNMAYDEGDGSPEVDPAVKAFLNEMKERFSPTAVSERVKASKEREAQGYEALLTYEMIVENPISENDPALDRMVAARSHVSPGASKATSRPARSFAEGKKVTQGRQIHVPPRPAAKQGSHKILPRGLSATRREKLLPVLAES